MSQHNKQEQPQQQPQIIQQKRYKPQKKIVTQKAVQKLKKENAKRILIVGDFVASTVADALKTLFIDNTDIIVTNDTIPDSGLVRTDLVSWQNIISQHIYKNKPDVLIMMIGANDNQSITTPYGILSTVQPEWLNIYRQRIIEIVENLYNSGKPWIWMGQPAFENDHLTQKMKIFNALYKQETEKAGGYFIDIWSGFTDEQGQFSFSGYDINGQFMRLRTHDGINFTIAGKRKLASYLEKKLENILNLHTFSQENLILLNGNTPLLPQQPNNIVRQAPMSLDDIAQQNTRLLDKIEPNFIKKLWSPTNGHQKDRADNFSFP
ncbi:hypothetical protein GCM10023260_09670 [Bartonella acomydis]|uniref:SGNH hydrolase-type esterase domain-containing protein n=1 Tax=Bartonella acomydis TaxID=686234 RepID=A0ABP9MS13_9HYPH